MCGLTTTAAHGARAPASRTCPAVDSRRGRTVDGGYTFYLVNFLRPPVDRRYTFYLIEVGGYMTWSLTVYVMIITSQTQHLEPREVVRGRVCVLYRVSG